MPRGARGRPLSPSKSPRDDPPRAPDEDSEHLVDVTVAAIEDKLGADPVVLSMTELLGVVDYFVICAGRNDRQVRTIAEEVESRAKRDCGRGPIRTEGLGDATWVLLDFGDVVVHVFAAETREYYDLEHLWSMAPRRALDPARAATEPA